MNVNNLIIGNKRHSQVLDLLRFPLAVVIVIVHVFYGQSNIVIHGVEYSFEGMTAFSFFMKFVFAFLKNQSVPIYFFISGYVFFLIDGAFSKKIYIKKLKNRIKTLLIPYILWNILAAGLFIACHYPPLSFFFPGLSVNNLNFSLSGILNVFWDVNASIAGNSESVCAWNVMPQDVPLWFVRDLMCLTLLSPIIYFVIKKFKLYAVLLFGMFWFYGSCSDSLTGEAPGLICRLFVGLSFFSFGAYFSINKIDMVYQLGKYSKMSFFMYPALGLLYIVLSYIIVSPLVLGVIKTLNIFVGLFFAYNIAALIIEKGIFRVSSFLASSSFFIYVAHGLIFDSIVKITLLSLKPISDFGVLGTYLLATTFVIMVLLGVYWLMRRYTPRLLGVLVGRKA